MDTGSERPGTSASRDQNSKMDVDGKEDGGELKIRGQAEAERRKDEMDVDKDAVSLIASYLPQVQTNHTIPQVDRAELERRESELKEKALRNKVVRTRKSSANLGASGAGN